MTDSVESNVCTSGGRGCFFDEPTTGGGVVLCCGETLGIGVVRGLDLSDLGVREPELLSKIFFGSFFGRRRLCTVSSSS